jgi:hypothetical protein
VPVIKWSAPLLLLLTTGAAEPAPDEQPLEYAQLIVREQIVVRTRRLPPPASRTPVEWKEGKGLKCVPAKAIAGAALIGQNSVDLILRDNRRIRARLASSCPALDYYYGFYIRPNADGMICADRDAIRSRVGGECGIDRFRTLEPKRRN